MSEYEQKSPKSLAEDEYWTSEESLMVKASRSNVLAKILLAELAPALADAGHEHI